MDSSWPLEPLIEENRVEVVLWMAAGLARAQRHFAARQRASAQAASQERIYRRTAPKVGRIDPCPCGSGKRFKHCCGDSSAQ